MGVILNLVWLIVAGIELAVAYVLAGVLLMLTIVGIPFGLQAFKLAGFALWPFGRAVVRTKSPGPIALVGNLLWVVLAGWWLVLAHILTGLVLALTIIGIPMAIANFKMVSLALAPFGRDVVDRDAIGARADDALTVR